MIEERYALDFQLEFYYEIIDSYHQQQRNRITKKDTNAPYMR
jgi:hypothetical protein